MMRVMRTGHPELHYETIERRARPARVAVLTHSADPDWHHTAVRIIEFLSSIWGGKHSVIIPTDGSLIDPVFWTILEKFSPDYVYFYRKTGGDLHISRPEEYAAHLQEEIRQYEKVVAASDDSKERIDQDLRSAYADRFGLDTSLCFEIANRLVPFHHESHFEPLTGHGYVPHQLTGIVDVIPYVDHSNSFACFQVPPELDMAWWAAYTGTYSATVSEQVRSLGFNEETTCVTPESLGNFVKGLAEREFGSWLRSPHEALGTGPGFMEPDETRPTPFDVSMSRTGLYAPPLSHRAVADRFALVLGDSLADFCLSYCLPRIGHRAVWLPLYWIKDLETSTTTPLKSCLSSAVYVAPYKLRRGPGLKVCSVSEAGAVPEVLDALRRYVGIGMNGERVDAVDATHVVAGATDAPIPYCIDSPNQSEIYPFLGDKSVGTIRSPRPNGFSTLKASKHRWVAEVIVSGRAIPTVPHIAENLVTLRQSVGSLDIRVSQQAVAYACPGSVFVIGDDISPNLSHPEIRLFDTFTAVSWMAAASGLKCQLSDKGIYQRDSLEKLGGISEAAQLLHDRGSRAVLGKFVDHARREQGTYDEGCVLGGRTYLDLAAAQKAMGGDETAAVGLIDKLIAAKVIYRGFVLGCNVCKHVEWYSLADLADEFRCTRCGREQTMRRENWRHPAAPQIFYKLDEIVYQFLKNDGDVVALSLDYMSRNSTHPFNYSPEIQFRKDSFSGEVDFCAVWNSILTIGEAKRQGELASSDSETHKIIHKYAHLATALNARQILFCTTSPEWKKSAIEAVHRAYKGKLAVPVFITAEKLLQESSTKA
jgi:hypothetical protein